MDNQLHVALVKKLYEVFMAGNIDGVLELLAKDVVFELPKMQGVPLGSRYDGHSGVRKFLADREPALKYRSFVQHKFFSDQDNVVVLGETTGNVIATDAPFHYNWVQVFEFSLDNHIQRFYELPDTQVLAGAFAA